MTQRELLALKEIAWIATMAKNNPEEKNFEDVCYRIKEEMMMADPDYYGLIGSAK